MHLEAPEGLEVLEVLEVLVVPVVPAVRGVRVPLGLAVPVGWRVASAALEVEFLEVALPDYLPLVGEAADEESAAVEPE